MDDLWIHPKAQRLPTPVTNAMVILKDGALLSVYGSEACFSRDDGRTWERRPLFTAGERKPRWENALIRCTSGAIVLVYMDEATKNWGWDDAKHEPVPNARMEVWSTRSLDEGRTWSESVKLFGGYCGAIIGMIQTRSGRLVVPVQRLLYDPGRHGQVTYVSDDEGLTWQHSNIIDIGGHGHHDGCFEGALVELRDGRLWMLLRTNLGRFWQAFSEDEGLSWRTILPTDIEASSAPAYVTRLSSGRLMMAWNRLYPEGLTPEQRAQWELNGGDCNICRPICSWHRRELSVAFSEDDGAHWTAPAVVLRSPRQGMAYPFILERKPGLIWIMTRFNERAGACLREADIVRPRNTTFGTRPFRSI